MAKTGEPARDHRDRSGDHRLRGARWLAFTAVALVGVAGSVGTAVAGTGKPNAVAGATASGCGARTVPQSAREIDTYDPCLASHLNGGVTFADQKLSSVVDGRNRVDLTTSTALAGAVASVQVNGKEFIASGGHGSAMQYVLHDDAKGECFNPTEAGTQADDNQSGWPAPYHGPSTSRIRSTTGDGHTLSTTSTMAMYLPNGAVSDFDGCVARYPGTAAFANGLSPYTLNRTISLGTSATGGLANVMRFDATVDSTNASTIADFDAVQIAYLQDDFTKFYAVDLAAGTATPVSDADFHSTNGAGYASGAAPVIAATPDGAYAIGIYTPGPLNKNNQESTLYSVGRNDGSGSYAFVNRTIQVTYYAHQVGTGRTSYTSYLVVGNLDRVVHDMGVVAKTRRSGGVSTFGAGVAKSAVMLVTA